MSPGNAACYEYCKVSDVKINQTALPGHDVGGLHMYEVTVENRCICTQLDVKVTCHGFNSSVNVHPEGSLLPDGDGEHCTIYGGLPIPNGVEYAVKFSYAWSSQLRLEPVSSTLACSISAASSSAVLLI